MNNILLTAAIISFVSVCLTLTIRMRSIAKEFKYKTNFPPYVWYRGAAYKKCDLSMDDDLFTYIGSYAGIVLLFSALEYIVEGDVGQIEQVQLLGMGGAFLGLIVGGFVFKMIGLLASTIWANFVLYRTKNPVSLTGTMIVWMAAFEMLGAYIGLLTGLISAILYFSLAWFEINIYKAIILSAPLIAITAYSLYRKPFVEKGNANYFLNDIAQRLGDKYQLTACMECPETFATELLPEIVEPAKPIDLGKRQPFGKTPILIESRDERFKPANKADN